MARARELIDRGDAGTATAAADKPGCAHPPVPRRRQADPSLPMLWLADGHHRDVRGRLARRDIARPRRSRHQDRHVMTPMAPHHPVTAADLCCWLDSGHDALGLSLYQTHATDLEKPQIRRSRRCFGRPSHRRHSCAAATPAAPAPSCTVSATQFPIEPAEPGAPIPRLRSLAAFERRPSVRGSVRDGPASETRHNKTHAGRLAGTVEVPQKADGIAAAR